MSTSNTNFIPLKLRSLNSESKLSFYDNSKNFILKDFKKKKYDKKIPKNVLITLTHAVYGISHEVRKTIVETKKDIFKLIDWDKLLRIIKNFSDFWTRQLIKSSWIPKKQVIINKASRLIWDANRSTLASDFLRTSDFNWVKIFSGLWKIRYFWESLTWEYHNDIYLNMKKIEEEEWWVIGFDIHDTWVRLMSDNTKLDSFRDFGFPLITLWTRDWKSCNYEILEYFAQRLEKYLWIKPYIDDPYNWWYVIKIHWEDYRKENKTKKRNMIQVEFWRFLYMKESTQEIDLERMKIVWEWLKRAISDIWYKFNEVYWKSL